jgi:hypothetical protein
MSDEKKLTWTEEYIREHFATCSCGDYEDTTSRVSVTVHLAFGMDGEYYHCEMHAHLLKKALSTTECLEGYTKEKALAHAERVGFQLVELLKHWETLNEVANAG